MNRTRMNTNRSKYMMALTISGILPRSFDNSAGWKKDADGKLVTDASGNPIYVDSAGAEKSVEGTTISRLNGEAKTHRERAEAAETKLRSFGDLDPEKARAAIEKLGQIDQSKLIESGKVEEVKRQITEQFTAQLTDRDTKLAAASQKINDMTLAQAFDNSKFMQERVAVPAEMVKATFGKNFKVDESGKIVATGADGNPLWSPSRAGEPASVDEALEIIIGGYAFKDQILKAPNANGTGNNGNGGNRPGSRVVSRADFDKAPPAKQAEYAGLAAKGEMTIAD